MGLRLGCGLAENAQVTTPGAWVGGLGLGCGPRGVSLKPGVGRASEVTWRALNGQTKLANHMPPTQAPPYPTGVGLGLFSTCQLTPPTQAPPYPMV
ncbi:hypothetical protein Hanom_Chr04g00337301 [Helianthus anomalus]